MKHFSAFVAAVLVALFPLISGAQTSPPVPASAVLSWTPPTLAENGSALTGAQAITANEIFASGSAIPDNIGSQPQGRVEGTVRNFTYTTTAPNNSTLYFRVRSCNLGGCSGLSAQIGKPIAVSVPGVPTGVAVTVTVVVQAQ